MLDFFILNDFTNVSWSQLDFLFFLVPPRLCSGGKRGRDDILRVSNDCGLSGLPPGKHSCSICCGSVLLPWKHALSSRFKMLLKSSFFFFFKKNHGAFVRWGFAHLALSRARGHSESHDSALGVPCLKGSNLCWLRPALPGSSPWEAGQGQGSGPVLICALVSQSPDTRYSQDVVCSGNALVGVQIIHLERGPRPA